MLSSINGFFVIVCQLPALGAVELINQTGIDQTADGTNWLSFTALGRASSAQAESDLATKQLLLSADYASLKRVARLCWVGPHHRSIVVLDANR